MGSMFALNHDFIASLAPRLAVLLLCLPVHEFAHAWAANKLGDDTATRQGRLTLNPFVHLDLFGGLLILLAGFGWAKPVPVDTRVFKHPRRDMALVSVAGPLANIIMAAIMLAVVKVIAYQVGIGGAFREVGTLGALFMMGSLANATMPELALMIILRDILLINLVLAAFNLLPIPPLDGSKFFGSLLPERHYFAMMRYERFVFPVLLLLMFTGQLGRAIGWLLFRLFPVIDFITMPIDLILGG